MNPLAANTRTHHGTSPSKLNALDACPQYVNQPSDNNTAADEGSLLHDVSQKIIEGWLADPNRGRFMPYVGIALRYAKSENKLHDEQVESVRKSLSFVADALEHAESVYTEEKLKVKNVDGSVLTFGYADLICFNKKQATIFDYKFGRHLVHEVSTNYQGWAYALSLFQEFPELSEVVVSFIQPRVESWDSNNIVFERSDINWMYAKIYSIIHEAHNKDALPHTGDQCKYCAKAGTCPAIVSKASELVKSYHSLPSIETFHGSQITDPKKMAAAFYIVNQLEVVIESVKKAAKEMAMNGETLQFIDPHGDLITYEIAERSEPREVKETPLLWDAVKKVMSPELFSGCVKAKIGELEKIYAETRVEQAKALGIKMTKTAAVAELRKKLIEEGIMSVSDVKVSFLRAAKQRTTKTKNKVIDI